MTAQTQAAGQTQFRVRRINVATSAEVFRWFCGLSLIVLGWIIHDFAGEKRKDALKG